MNHLKILKTDTFWWVMLGYMLGVHLGHEVVFEQIGADWDSFYEMPWHPLLVQLFMIVSHTIALILVIAVVLLLATLLQAIHGFIKKGIKRLWNNVKNK